MNHKTAENGIPSDSVKAGTALGTDRVGRDVFSQAIYGARVSLSIGALCGFTVLLSGMTLGLLAGYIRWLDAAIMAPWMV